MMTIIHILIIVNLSVRRKEEPVHIVTGFFLYLKFCLKIVNL